MPIPIPFTHLPDSPYVLYPTIFPYHALPSVPLYLIYIGILTLQPTTLAQPKAKASAFNRHEFFMFYLGLPSIFLGSLAIIINKSVNGYPHFTTWHGVSLSKARHTYNLLIHILCLVPGNNRPIMDGDSNSPRSWECMVRRKIFRSES